MEIRGNVVNVAENGTITSGTEYIVGKKTWCAALFVPNAEKKARSLYIQIGDNDIILNGRQINELKKLLNPVLWEISDR